MKKLSEFYLFLPGIYQLPMDLTITLFGTSIFTAHAQCVASDQIQNGSLHAK